MQAGGARTFQRCDARTATVGDFDERAASGRRRRNCVVDGHSERRVFESKIAPVQEQVFDRPNLQPFQLLCPFGTYAEQNGHRPGER